MYPTTLIYLLGLKLLKINESFGFLLIRKQMCILMLLKYRL